MLKELKRRRLVLMVTILVDKVDLGRSLVDSYDHTQVIASAIIFLSKN